VECIELFGSQKKVGGILGHYKKSFEGPPSLGSLSGVSEIGYLRPFSQMVL
jgi:hypothetical protein